MNANCIKNVSGLQVYDSRGNPTVEVEITLHSGLSASAVSPSGASVGKDEAFELKDYNEHGVGHVTRAVENVNKIINKGLRGVPIASQVQIDEILLSLDGTSDKSKLGGNAMIATSLAAAKLASEFKGLKFFEYLGGMMSNVLPTPMLNFINGGVHADNGLDIQEFMIMPVSANSFSEAMEMSADVLKVLRNTLKIKGFNLGIGDEGGYAPQISSTDNCLDLLMLAIEKAGYKPGKDFLLCMDVAASGLFKNGKYSIDGEEMFLERLISFYKNLIVNYPIFSIEDPISEIDNMGFKKITSSLSNIVQIVGDDFFATNPKKIEKGITEKAANAVLIKPNQIGTLSETLDAISVAQLGNFSTVVSHRSGESEDVSIAHIAVGCNILQIKTGSLMRTDRVAKYNELLRIEKYLGRSAVYSGSMILEKYNKFRSNIHEKKY